MPEITGLPSADSEVPAGLVEPAYPRPVRRFLIFLVLAPMLWLGLLMYTYGVDTPYWDDWDQFPSDLAKLHDGTLSWTDLIAQQNEHRVLFPRIILLATAWLTSWNNRAELFIVWLLACLSSFSLWRLSRVTGSSDSNLDLFLLGAANVLLFTPVAFENWLGGGQIVVLLPLAAMTMALWLVSISRPPFSFLFAIVLSFISTFSMASGFLCWLIVLPLLLFPRGRLQWSDRLPGLACWLVGLMGSLAIYLHGYTEIGDGPSLLSVVEEPDTAMLYLFAYLGSAFGWCIGFTMTLFCGGAWLVLFAGALIYLWRFRTDSLLIARTLPWVMLSSYGLLNGVITMLGRIGYGAGQATAPRYITFAVLLPIGLLFILQKIYAHWRKGPVTKPLVHIVFWGLVTCTVVGLVTNIYCSFAILDHWKLWRQARLHSQALVEFVLITKEDELTKHLTYGDFDRLRKEARRMGELGYLRPPPVTDGAISNFVNLRVKPTADHGYFDSIFRAQNGQAFAYGWAILPDEDRPADSVLLTYEDVAHPGIPVIFSITLTGHQRIDVVQNTQQDEFEFAGWVRALTPGLLPPGPHRLRAWAFNLQENRAYPLKGSSVFDEAVLPPPAGPAN